MRPHRIILSLALALLLAGAEAALGETITFSKRSDGWYAPPKKPAAVKDYSVDWSQWLAGDTILTSTWTYATGITGGAESLNAAKTVATTWFSGGTAGQKYLITQRITTAGGRTDLVSFKIEVKE